MRVVVTGGHGFIGRSLTAQLLRRGQLRGRPIEALVVADLVADPAITDPPQPQAGPGRHQSAVLPARTSVLGPLAERLDELFAEPVEVVVHLASAVSSACEADLDLGLRSNVDTTRALLDRARRQAAQGGPVATVVFSSSVAVYGGDPALPLPQVVDESTVTTPQSSYGIQKLVCEQLIADYTRRGLVDGRVVRLMTVAVRPGVPNAAASSFVSGIVREPLAGQPAICPVGRDVPLAIASPARTVEGLLRVAEAGRGTGPGQLSGRLPVNLPALTVTVGELLEALRELAGDAVDLVTEQVDPAVEAIVTSWPSRFDNSRAAQLGLRPDPNIAWVLRHYVTTHPDAVRVALPGLGLVDTAPGDPAAGCPG